MTRTAILLLVCICAAPAAAETAGPNAPAARTITPLPGVTPLTGVTTIGTPKAGNRGLRNWTLKQPRKKKAGQLAKADVQGPKVPPPQKLKMPVKHQRQVIEDDRPQPVNGTAVLGAMMSGNHDRRRNGNNN